MFTMAIFSQMDEESEVDFRNVDVNGNHPNRMVPFNLPNESAYKIHKLMHKLKLESGSIDIIVDNNNDYYFLEVNPVGQFNFVSEICNYHIEKYIANFLVR
jgi:glutathione synthase/RimK-type ligase-like ATP-grasp enzyme